MYTPIFVSALLASTILAAPRSYPPQDGSEPCSAAGPIPTPLAVSEVPTLACPKSQLTYATTFVIPKPSRPVTWKVSVTEWTVVPTPPSGNTTSILRKTTSTFLASWATMSASTTVNSSTSLESSTPVETQIPESTETPAPEPEVLAGVYICSDVGWTGECVHHMTPVGTAPSDCTQLDGTASSIGPDHGFICNFYTNSYCDPLATNGTDVIILKYPGVGDMLKTGEGDYNDRIRSYQCLMDDASSE